jgi:hypothetical protein
VASSITIKSPSPNNNLIHILTQTVDAEGNPVGASQSVTVLDDGQEWTGRIDQHTVVMQVEMPRNAPPVAAAEPVVTEPDVPETEQDTPPVIGAADPAQPAPVAA